MRTMLIALGAILAVCGVSCGFLSSYQLWQLQFEVNEHLPPEQRFEPLFWTFRTHRKLRELKSQHLPNSSRLTRSIQFGMGGCCFFFCGVALLLAGLR